MAMFIFARAILAGEPIKLFNHGKMRRDFTFIDDVKEAVVRLIDHPSPGRPDWDRAPVDASASSAPWKIYNIGNNRPEDLMHVVSLLDKEFGRTAIKEMLPMQPGDEATSADIAELERDIGFQPSTRIEDGVARFAKWYREYHRIQPIENSSPAMMWRSRDATVACAPAVSFEQVHDWFKLPKGLELPYMIMTADVRPEHRAALPAITHVNGSAACRRSTTRTIRISTRWCRPSANRSRNGAVHELQREGSADRQHPARSHRHVPRNRHRVSLPREHTRAPHRAEVVGAKPHILRSVRWCEL
jgi:hypothetical protein